LHDGFTNEARVEIRRTTIATHELEAYVAIENAVTTRTHLAHAALTEESALLVSRIEPRRFRDAVCDRSAIVDRRIRHRAQSLSCCARFLREPHWAER
jgi:hypothetical protein